MNPGHDPEFGDAPSGEAAAVADPDAEGRTADAESDVDAPPRRKGVGHRLRLKREARYGLAALLSFLVLVTVLLLNKGRGKTGAEKVPPVNAIGAGAAAVAARPPAPKTPETPPAPTAPPQPAEAPVATADEHAHPVPAYDPATPEAVEPVQLARNDPPAPEPAPAPAPETTPAEPAPTPEPAPMPTPEDPPSTGEIELPPLGNAGAEPTPEPQPPPVATGETSPAPAGGPDAQPAESGLPEPAAEPTSSGLPEPAEAPTAPAPAETPATPVPAPAPAEPQGVEAPANPAVAAGPVGLPEPAPAPAEPAASPAPAGEEGLPAPAEASASPTAEPIGLPEPAASPSESERPKPEPTPAPAEPTPAPVEPTPNPAEPTPATAGETPAEPVTLPTPVEPAGTGLPEPGPTGASQGDPPAGAMPAVAEPVTPQPAPVDVALPAAPAEATPAPTPEDVPPADAPGQPAGLVPLPTGATPAAPGAGLPSFATVPGDPAESPPTAAPAEASAPVPEPEPRKPEPAKAEPRPPGDWVPLPSAGPARPRPEDARRSPDPAARPLEPAPERVAVGRPLPVGPAVRAAQEPPAVALAVSGGPQQPASPRQAGAAVEWVPHVVQRGESFWTISQLYYGSARYYKALHAANVPKVGPLTKPLYVGQTIHIPPPEALEPTLIEPARGRTLATSKEDPLPSESRTATVRPASSRPGSGRGNAAAPRAPGELEVALPSSDPFARRFTPEADDPEPPAAAVPSRPRRPVYKVRPHETLRSIARDTLAGSRRPDEILRRADEIHELNADVIDDPNRLPENLILQLPYDAKVGLGAAGRRDLDR